MTNQSLYGLVLYRVRLGTCLQVALQEHKPILAGKTARWFLSKDPFAFSPRINRCQMIPERLIRLFVHFGYGCVRTHRSAVRFELSTLFEAESDAGDAGFV